MRECSVQGYGQPDAGRWFYPGSGATGDTRPPPPKQQAQPPAPAGAAAAAAGTDTPAEDIEEDPDREFSGSSPEPAGPLRMINVGIPGPGALLCKNGGRMAGCWLQQQCLDSLHNK